MAHPTGTVCVVRTEDGHFSGKRVWWLFDNHRTIKGGVGGTLRQLVRVWRSEVGEVRVLIRYAGFCPLSVAACTVGALQHPMNVGQA